MFTQTERTTALRMRERMHYDRDLAYAILDEAWHCTLSFVVNGEPRALPTLVVRIDDTVYFHGSTGSRPGLTAPMRVCMTVTHLDALVLARSQFHHSANYRSLVAHGVASPVTGEDEKRRMLTALMEKIGHGRSQETREPNAKELAQTVVLALKLDEVSVRVRDGGVNDDEEDLGLPYWAGIIPTPVVHAAPIPAPGVEARMPLNLGVSRWQERVTLRGDHVILEPLQPSHVDGLFAAIGDDDEVWRHIPVPAPRTLSDMAGFVAKWLGTTDRITFIQRSARSGEIVGVTSITVEEGTQTLEIGGTILAQKAWRTGINTEAKLMLLEHAFGTLKARRVSWQTDVLNTRSQNAIARLGAVREGVLRANRNRNDGTARDSVIYSMIATEWPNAQSALRARLSQD